MQLGDEKTMNSSIASQFVISLEFNDLPNEAVQIAKTCLLDFLGVAISGTSLPAAKSGLKLLNAFGQKEEATIISFQKKVPVIAAVWANALLGSVLDMEDGQYTSVSHPSSVVFPITLAITEREQVHPKEFLTASIIGYEIFARSGALMSRKYRERMYGFGAPGVYAAASAAARLLKLNSAGLEMALGIAGSYMPTIPVLRSIEHEAMTKGGGTVGGFCWGNLSPFSRSRLHSATCDTARTLLSRR